MLRELNVRFSAWGPGTATTQAATVTADHVMSLLREGIVGNDEAGNRMWKILMLQFLSGGDERFLDLECRVESGSIGGQEGSIYR